MTANSPLRQYVVMKLGAWLEQNGRTATWLADKTGISVSHVCRLIERNGVTEKMPSMEACAKISEATDGEVTANDFMPVTASKKRNRRDRVRVAA